jgi:hypothetical protein
LLEYVMRARDGDDDAPEDAPAVPDTSRDDGEDLP